MSAATITHAAHQVGISRSCIFRMHGQKSCRCSSPEKCIHLEIKWRAIDGKVVNVVSFDRYCLLIAPCEI